MEASKGEKKGRKQKRGLHGRMEGSLFLCVWWKCTYLPGGRICLLLGKKDTRQQGTENINASSHSLLRFTTFVLPNLLCYK